MTPEQLSVTLLAIVGVLMQLAFRYVPKLSAWYDAQANKGTTTLLIIIVVGCAYTGLACSPYALRFGIALPCTQDGLFTMLQALFILAGSQQLTYLFMRNGTPQG